MRHFVQYALFGEEDAFACARVTDIYVAREIGLEAADDTPPAQTERCRPFAILFARRLELARVAVSRDTSDEDPYGVYGEETRDFVLAGDQVVAPAGLVDVSAFDIDLRFRGWRRPHSFVLQSIRVEPLWHPEPGHTST